MDLFPERIRMIRWKCVEYKVECEMTWAISTKLSKHILYSSRSACIDPQVIRSRSHCHKNRHGHTVASDACCYCRVLLLPARVCMSIRLPMFSSCYYYLCGASSARVRILAIIACLSVCLCVCQTPVLYQNG